jgi:hypothetical protein
MGPYDTGCRFDSRCDVLSPLLSGTKITAGYQSIPMDVAEMAINLTVRRTELY